MPDGGHAVTPAHGHTGLKVVPLCRHDGVPLRLPVCRCAHDFWFHISDGRKEIAASYFTTFPSAQQFPFFAEAGLRVALGED